MSGPGVWEGGEAPDLVVDRAPDPTFDRAAVLIQLRNALRRLNAELRSSMRERAALLDLPPAVYLVLTAIVHQGPLQPRQLVEVLLTDKSSISRHVALLHQRGLLSKAADEEDGRMLRLAATPDGLRRVAEAEARFPPRWLQATAAWPEAELRALAEGLDRLSRGPDA